MSKPAAQQSIEERIGVRIRALREKRSVTLDQLAAEIGITKGQLSKIENGKVSSPVSTLTRVAASLDVSPGYFFQEENGRPRAALIPRKARMPIARPGSKLGHSYESLAFGLPFEKDFEAYLMRIEEKEIDPRKNVFRHPGHELLFMLKGGMDYRHADVVYHLSVGDSLFFDGTITHGPLKVYNPPVEFISVISNPRT